MEFAKPPLTAVNPQQAMKELQQQKAELQKNMDSFVQQIKDCAAQRADIAFAVDYFHVRAEKYDVISQLSQSQRTFVLEGYIPAQNTQKLEARLETSFDVVVEYADPGEKDDVPVLLKNNGFAEAVEPVVESYSLPSKGELDPSMLVACSYYVLFGMMLSDAAYGLSMADWQCCLPEKNERYVRQPAQNAEDVLLTAAFPPLFLVSCLALSLGTRSMSLRQTFFNRPDIKLAPLWFEPINKPMKMLVFCFAVGILHLFVGLGAKLYMCIKNGHPLDGRL
jgi:V/A-type H+-transporting ATPase subunit I